MKRNTIFLIALLLSVILLFLAGNHDFYSEKYIQLTDNYDDQNSNVFDLLDRDDTLPKLKGIYEELINNNGFEYIEVMDQPIEYIGEFTGNNDAIYGGIECKNQHIDNYLITPLDSLQLSNSIQKNCKISALVVEGRAWNNEDFGWNESDEINVILGNGYSNNFKIGDKIKGIYLGEKHIYLNVIGFLRKNASCNICGDEIELDNIILMPAVNLINDISHNDMFERILYLQKIECYVKCASNRQLVELEKQLNDINNKYDFKYNYYVKNKYSNYKFLVRLREIAIYTIYLVFFSSIIILVNNYWPNKNKKD